MIEQLSLFQPASPATDNTEDLVAVTRALTDLPADRRGKGLTEAMISQRMKAAPDAIRPALLRAEDLGWIDKREPRTRKRPATWHISEPGTWALVAAAEIEA